MKAALLCIVLTFLCCGAVYSQSLSRNAHADKSQPVTVPKFEKPPTIDGKLDVKLGNGDDTLLVEQTTVTGRARLDGGNPKPPAAPGDTAALTANMDVAFGAGSTIKNFETDTLSP